MSKLFESFVATKATVLALTSRRALSYPGAERALSSVGAWKQFVRTHSGVCTETTAKATIRLWNRHCGKGLPEHEVALTINNVKAQAKWKQVTSLSNVAKNWAYVAATYLLEHAVDVYGFGFKGGNVADTAQDIVIWMQNKVTSEIVREVPALWFHIERFFGGRN